MPVIDATNLKILSSFCLDIIGQMPKMFPMAITKSRTRNRASTKPRTHQKPIWVRPEAHAKLMEIKQAYRGLRIVDAADMVIDAWSKLSTEEQNELFLRRPSN